LIRRAFETGPFTSRLVEAILGSRAHPQQGFRSCLGIMRLGKPFGADRLAKAFGRTLALGALGYRNVESILKNGLDRRPLPGVTPPAPVVEHDNLRGSQSYQ